MLGLLRTESRGQFDAINAKAVQFYSAQTAGKPTPDPVARAEEIYHRLALGESAASVAPLVGGRRGGVPPRRGGGLHGRRASDISRQPARRRRPERPVGPGPHRGLGASGRQARRGPHQAERSGQGACGDQQPLGAAPAGQPAVPARSALRLSRRTSPRRRASRTPGSARRRPPATTLRTSTCCSSSLACFARRGDGLAARANLGEAVDVAARLPDPTRAIDALARLLRLGRGLGVPPADDAARRTDLGLP